jgi:hypothetical protein
VVRLGRPKAGDDGISACCARDALLLPGPPVTGSRGDMDWDVDAEGDVEVLGLGCSLAFFLRWRTLCERLAMNWYCVGW